MTIAWDKQGLRLGWVLRGALLDSAGVEQTIRVCGPAARIGTGHVGADPDAPDGPGRYWRAARGEVTLIDDAGKLDQHIGIPGQLDVEIPISYPEDPRLETADPTGDELLRAWALDGRWANRRVDVWLVDLDTEDTEHRFRGAWDADPETLPGGLSLSAREHIGPLGAPWKVGRLPPNDADWLGDAQLLNAFDIYNFPDPYFIHPPARGKALPCAFGSDPGPVSNTTPGRSWVRMIPYGRSIGYGVAGGAPIGNATDPVYWCWVSPQYGVSVGVVRILADDGVVYESGTAPVATVGLVGHNYYPARGPLGTICLIQVAAATAVSIGEGAVEFWARVSGPPLAGATSREWSTTFGEPWVGGFGAQSGATQEVEDLLTLLIEDAEYLGLPGLLGSSAIGDFIAGRPAVSPYGRMLAVVPSDASGWQDKTPTYRDALSALMAGLPADLVWRYDAATGDRRLWPWWRRPRLGEVEDFVIGPADLASAAPRLSIRGQSDPHREYGTECEIASPSWIEQPASVPFDSGALHAESSHGVRILDAAEELAHGAALAARRGWAWWTVATDAGALTAAKYIAGETTQRQRWTEATLGGRWLQLQIGDTIRYAIHGVTAAVGMVRRLEYDLARQTVTVSACHAVHYAADAAEET